MLGVGGCAEELDSVVQQRVGHAKGLGGRGCGPGSDWGDPMLGLGGERRERQCGQR